MTKNHKFKFSKNSAQNCNFFGKKIIFLQVVPLILEIKRGLGCDDTVLVLLGNKLDMKDHREVATGEGKTKAAKINAKFYEISAYDSTRKFLEINSSKLGFLRLKKSKFAFFYSFF